MNENVKLPLHFMDGIKRNFLILFAVFFCLNNLALGENPDELYIEAVQLDSTSKFLQLNISWDAAFAENSSLFDVKVNHVPSANCSIEQSLFAERDDIKCAPVVAETEFSSILLPHDTRALLKHECEILPSCIYEVEVKSLDSFSSIKKVFQVPHCVNDVCSCFHDKFLPAIRANASVSVDHVVVNWTIGDYSNQTLPENVSLDHIKITVRRGMNEDLNWGGKDSSKLTVILAATPTGRYQFNVSDFKGNKSIFVINVSLYDNRRCVSEAEPVRVFLSNATAPSNTTDYSTEITEPAYNWSLLYIGIIIHITIGIWMIRKCKPRARAGTSDGPGDVYVEGRNDAFPPIPMEENLLYVDQDIMDARARGEADMFEVTHDCLTIGHLIGRGAFGKVFMAKATNLPGIRGPIIVAVKQLQKSPRMDALDEFVDEISMLKLVGYHPNIVQLLGCCTIKEPFSMIMEFIGCGDLLEYLRKVRHKHEASTALFHDPSAVPSSPADVNGSKQSTSSVTGSVIYGSTLKYLDIGTSSGSNSDGSYITNPDTVTRPSLTDTTYTTLSDRTAQNQHSLEYVLDHTELHYFARQIASGMEHLEQIGITHRDLAARNVLIDEHKTLKISDFGMSRSGIYINTRNKKVPLRWLSIEAIKDNFYSSKSDVWAFGVVLWEIGTLGGYPYPSVINQELLKFLVDGNRLLKPDNCTQFLYNLMLDCWKPEPDQRPSFKEISGRLAPHQLIYIDFNNIRPNYVFPPTAEQIREAMLNNKA